MAKDEAGVSMAPDGGPRLPDKVAGPADDGSAPADLLEVLARRVAGSARIHEVVAQLAGHRLLVPLLQVAGAQLAESEFDPCSGTDAAMAVVSTTDAQGAHVGLAFTGMPALRAWNREARPLPTPASEVAAAVLRGGGRTLLVDPGSATGCPVSGLALLRLASGEPWPDPWADPFVGQAVAAELSDLLAAGVAVRLAAPGSGSRADLVVVLSGTLDLNSVAARLRRSPLLASTFDGTLEVAGTREVTGAPG